MASFLEFLSNNELTIVVCLMVIVFGLIMTIIIIDIYSRKTNTNNIIDQDDIDEVNDQINSNINTTGLGMIADDSVLEEIDVESVTKNLEKTQEIEEIRYVEEDEDLEKTKALLELETIKQELAKMENIDYLDEEPVVTKEEVREEIETIDENVINEENINPIQAQIEPSKIEVEQEVEIPINTPTIEDEVERFESDQEEHAIISVEELARASQNITDEEIEKYEDDGNEPISLKELEEMYKSAIEPVEEIQEVIEEKLVEQEEKITLPDFDITVKPAVDVYEDKNFKTTPVISPVFGVKQTESSISLEQTANLDKLNEEMKKTNEFLSTLKELRKNLD